MNNRLPYELYLAYSRLLLLGLYFQWPKHNSNPRDLDRFPTAGCAFRISIAQSIQGMVWVVPTAFCLLLKRLQPAE